MKITNGLVVIGEKKRGNIFILANDYLYSLIVFLTTRFLLFNTMRLISLERLAFCEKKRNMPTYIQH